jgi:galactokinase
VTAARLARNFPGSSLGADIVFASDLPRAAGMSSSSALIVGTATALIHVGHLRARAEWQRDIRSAVDEAGYLGCVENGRTFGALTGDAGVGTHGGSEDHAAMLAGTAGACTAFAFVPLRHLDTIQVPAQWTILISSSGIASHKTGTERGAYNRLSDGTSRLLELWNAHEPPQDSVAAALASSEGALARLHVLVSESSVDGWTKTALKARLDHFAHEDARIGDSVPALRNADARALGRLAADSQADAERLLSNQVPETVMLTRLAVDAGAIAARSFGAGFGGSVWAAIQSTGEADDRRFLDRWMSTYRAACPEPAVRALSFVSKPGPPVTKVA